MCSSCASQRTVEAIIASMPDVTADYVMNFLWNQTPFPFAVVTARDLYDGIDRNVRASKNGIQLCDHCDRAVEGCYTCDRCRKLLGDSADAAKEER